MSAAKPMTRAERKAATRAALIKAGERLVRKKGFAVSVDEIAAAAGFTKGAVYSNFAGRAELFEEISHRVIPGYQIQPDYSLPLAEAMEDAARQEVAALDRDPDQFVLQLDGMVQLLRDKELRESFLRGRDEERLVAQNAEQLQAWEMPVPAEWFWVAVNAVGLGLAAHRLLFGPEETPEELFVWVHRRLAGAE